MRYDGPKLSCPRFDDALAKLKKIREACEEIKDWCDDAESEIENAREINGDLRDDNVDLQNQVETLEAHEEILLDRVREFEKEQNS